MIDKNPLYVILTDKFLKGDHDMDFRMAFTLVFSAGILVDGIVLLANSKGNKKGVLGGIFSIIAGVFFGIGSVIGIIRFSSGSTSTLVLLEWIFYLVGFAIFIIGLIIRKKAGLIQKKQ